jgi:hypothetical protein
MDRTYGRKGNLRTKSRENGKMIQISTYPLKFADIAIKKKREEWGNLEVKVEAKVRVEVA